MRQTGRPVPVPRRRRRRFPKFFYAVRRLLDRLRRNSAVGPSAGGADADLVPEIAADGDGGPIIPAPPHGIEILEIGRRWRLPKRPGELTALHGTEAIRVRVSSSIPLISMQIRLDGRAIREAPATPPPDASSLPYVYVFNEWIDFRGLPSGIRRLQLLFAERGLCCRSYEETIRVEPLDEGEGDCRRDAASALDPDAGRTLDERINALPSVIHSARRSLLPRPPRRVLVIRTDQLGDLVISIPAIRRLRELLPDAELVGLVSPGNRALAESLSLFDTGVTAEFPYDPIGKRRVMPLETQRELRRRLHRFGFDLAIDLSLSGDSRPLLRLSGAPFTVGFGTRAFPWMTLGIDVATPDPANGQQRASHAALVLMLVEALGAALRRRPVIQPPAKADPAILARFGVAAGHYALLHSGARLRVQRWPFGHYVALARHILDRGDLDVVLIADDEAPPEAALIDAAGLPPERFRFVARRLPLDELEGLVAHCAVFVGNDSGPKHLAALRGAKVVSVHGGRVNWSEWGQEGDGLIITRHVPCYGCGIEDDRDCGKGLACLANIRPNEVYAAVEQLLDMAGAPGEAADAAASARPPRA